MRKPLLAAAILAAAVWPNETRLILVSTAAVVVEALPFVLAGVLAERAVRHRTCLVAYAGCGCIAGPSARSLPAAALTWVAFGPLPALARVAAATIVARRLHGREPTPCGHGSTDLVGELERLVPFALAAAIGGLIVGRLQVSHANVALQIAAGAALGFFASPCAIGSVAVASALRTHAAAAAAGFLCVSGIVDLHALHKESAKRKGGDACAYALLSIGAGIVAFRHGAELVRPALAPVLAVCAAAAAALAIVRRNESAGRMHAAPAIVLLGALMAAPPAIYRATETTLAEIFPGEHLSFTGVLARDRNAAALVRYAITCCRADAAPVVIRLARPAAITPGTWARAEGIVVGTPDGMALSEDRITPVPAPEDPFLYR